MDELRHGITKSYFDQSSLLAKTLTPIKDSQLQNPQSEFSLPFCRVHPNTHTTQVQPHTHMQMDQDQQWLINCLNASLDPNHQVRNFAETSLNQASLQPGDSDASFHNSAFD